MPTNRTCPECGGTIRADARQATCARCLLSLGLQDRGPEPTANDTLSPGAQGPAVGARLRYFGDYELLENIACGGMGMVFKARQISLNRVVALKVMLGGTGISPEFVRRFRTEAKAAGSLEHPNIVPIYEVGEYEGQQFYSMRFVEGGSLAQRICDFRLTVDATQPGHRTLDRAGLVNRKSKIVNLVATVAHAVHHAHQRGILHRDLKPGNILIDADGQPHVTDFGLAKILAQDSNLTQSLAVMGTPCYMAPEQASGRTKHLTTAADLYGLGAILYELLAGRPPFKADTPAETMRLVAEVEPPRPCVLNSSADKDLETICLKCLEKDPQRRYASAAAMAEDLECWLRGEPIRARPASTGERVWRWCKRNPAVAGMAAAVFLLLVMLAVGASIAAWNIDHHRRRAEQAERGTREQLHDSLLAQARANRVSGLPGRRFESLDAIARAVAIKPSLPLRNEAVAAMALLDVRPIQRWQFDRGSAPPAFNAELNRYVIVERTNRIALRRTGEQSGDTGGRWEIPLNDRPRSLQLDRTSDFLITETWSDGVRQSDIWKLTSGEHILSFTNARASLGPNNDTVVALLPSGGVYIYDLHSRRPIRVVAQQLTFEWIKFEERGRRFAGPLVGEPNQIVVYDAIADTPLCVLDHHGPANRDMAWHPDGRHLATLYDETRDRPTNLFVHLWDVESGRLETQLKGHEGSPISIAFSNDGHWLVSSGWDNTTRVWNWRSGRQILLLPQAGYVRLSVDSSKMILRDWDGSGATLFEVASGRELVVITESGQPTSGGERIAFNRSGTVVAHTIAGKLKLRETNGRELAVLTNTVFGVGLHADPLDEGFCAGTHSGIWNVRIRTTGADQVLFEPPEPVGPRRLLALFAITADGSRLFTGTANASRWQCLDRLTFEPMSTAMADHPNLRWLACTPDGRWVATGGWNEPSVRIWDGFTGQLVRQLEVENMGTVAFSPDGRWLVVGSRDYLFFEVGTWKHGLRLPRPAGEGWGAMAFSRDGRIFAHSHRSRSVQLTDTLTGEELATLDPPSSWPVRFLAFDPDASLLAMAGENTIEFHVWNLRLIREQLAKMGLDWHRSRSLRSESRY